jgi:glycosyltransferase involved in cell wall biosynthesis
MADRILAILDHRSSTFMEDDVNMLGRHFDIDVIYRTDYSRIRYLILEAAKRLLLHRPRLIYFWFVKPWDTATIVLLARLIGIKSILVTGGFDVAYVPEINYGMMRLPKARPWTRFALQQADLVIPFSEFSKDEVSRLAHARQLQVIYPGVDVDTFHPSDSQKQDLVVTVGAVGHSYFRRKGLEVFARCSKIMPQVQFMIIGRVIDNDVLEYLKSLGGGNLSFSLTYITTEELIGLYQQAKVYAQASMHEGFGVAVAEAMACECVPVVTKVAALPEVVGDTGFYTTYGDVGATATALGKALDSQRGTLARQRVLDNFTLEQREGKLLDAITSLLT